MPDFEKLIIAIDGYSSCGKSTFAKMIAQKLGYTYIDTGSMYRAVTLFAMRNNLLSDLTSNQEHMKVILNYVNIHFAKNVITGQNDIFLNDENVEEDIRSMDVAKYVSQVSQLKFVREKMVDLQRKMGEERGVVIDGRDIGTVVFPNANIKIFMTADPDVRAQRRYDELIAKGIKINFQEVKENIVKRDILDTTRAESPLKQAPDAYVLDNSHMTFDDQMTWFEKILKKGNRRPETGDRKPENGNRKTRKKK